MRSHCASCVSPEDDDIDELPPERIKDIGYVSPNYFWELAQEERKKLSLSKVLLEDEDLPYGHAQNWKMWTESRKFTLDIIQYQDEFTFPEVPESNVIIAVKSGLGTNKTGAMILKMLEASKGVRLIGYRNNLLFQTICRATGKVKLYHLNGESAGNLVILNWFKQQVTIKLLNPV